MIAYTLVYAVLAVIEIKLFLTYVRRGADPFEEPTAQDGGGRGRSAPVRLLIDVRTETDMTLNAVIWFGLIGLLWAGYLVLEGFDFGVGALLPVLGKGRHATRTPTSAAGSC
jgi:hypothetical protein